MQARIVPQRAKNAKGVVAEPHQIRHALAAPPVLHLGQGHAGKLSPQRRDLRLEVLVLRLERVDVDAHGRAHDALKATLGPLNYQNLDELPQFAGKQTTTEYLSRYIFDAMADAARTGALGPGGEGIVKICVKLHESHVARAWFEGKV
jgi:hypothetical protein